MMKRLIVALIISTILFSGCGNQENDIPADDIQADDVPVQNDTDLTGKESTTEYDTETDEDQDANENVKVEEDDGRTIEEKFAEAAGVDESEIHFLLDDDLDGDGTEEVFAITGKGVDYDLTETGNVEEGILWFYKDGECQKLAESEGYGFNLDCTEMKLDDVRFFICSDDYATGSMSYAFRVQEGKVAECTFSRKGTVYWTEGEDTFRIRDSSYDAGMDKNEGFLMGHTWKNYYFYYDKPSDEVREYGGTEITAEKADSLASRKIMEECDIDGEIDSIYYRGNGIININYHVEDADWIDYYHYNWDERNKIWIDDFGDETSPDEPCPGTYLPALCPDIAEEISSEIMK